MKSSFRKKRNDAHSSISFILAFIFLNLLASENYFEKLYSDCIENDVKGTGYKYHFDHMIGYVGYNVATETSMGGYYYMMQKNSDNEILSSFYGFEGILKALD